MKTRVPVHHTPVGRKYRWVKGRNTFHDGVLRLLTPDCKVIAEMKVEFQGTA